MAGVLCTAHPVRRPLPNLLPAQAHPPTCILAALTKTIYAALKTNAAAGTGMSMIILQYERA